MRKSDIEETCTDMESYLVSILHQIQPPNILPSGVIEDVKAQIADLKDPSDSSLLKELNTSPVLQSYPSIQCTKCRHSLKIRDIAFVNEAMTMVLCPECYGQGRLCAFCGENAEKGETQEHANCLSEHFSKNSTVPIVVKDRELSDKEVFGRLTGELLEVYKEKAGLIAYFLCPYSLNSLGKVDFSKEILQCSCGLDLSQVPHIPSQGLLLPPSNLLRYQTNREAVQDYISATSHRVVQCPYCYGPNLDLPSLSPQKCTICEGMFYSCCSCKAVPVNIHGGSLHRENCQMCTREYREERCEDCEMELCRTPHSLKVPGRFSLAEIYHLDSFYSLID